MTQSSYLQPSLGFGLGFRANYAEEILQTKPNVDWFEFLTDDYLVPNAKAFRILEKIRAHYPMVMHGVALSVGGSDPIDWNYVAKLKHLAKAMNVAWISDHLSFRGVHQINTHDLLPLPYTQETLQHVASRILAVQEFLGQRLVIENVSSYVSYETSEMNEYEFLSELVKVADCLLLVDINNIYVSSYNHDLNAKSFVRNLPKDRIQQIHLAGHQNLQDYLLDTHDNDIVEPVWKLYEYAMALYGFRSTMIERDDNFPSLSVLVAELQKAREIVTTFSERAMQHA